MRTDLRQFGRKRYHWQAVISDRISDRRLRVIISAGLPATRIQGSGFGDKGSTSRNADKLLPLGSRLQTCWHSVEPRNFKRDASGRRWNRSASSSSSNPDPNG